MGKLLLLSLNVDSLRVELVGVALLLLLLLLLGLRRLGLWRNDRFLLFEERNIVLESSNSPSLTDGVLGKEGETLIGDVSRNDLVGSTRTPVGLQLALNVHPVD